MYQSKSICLIEFLGQVRTFLMMVFLEPLGRKVEIKLEL